MGSVIESATSGVALRDPQKAFSITVAFLFPPRSGAPPRRGKMGGAGLLNRVLFRSAGLLNSTLFRKNCS